MERETFFKRTSLNKRSKEFGYILDLAKDGICRPCTVSGKGRYINQDDRTESVKEALKNAGVKFEFGNDATRGGKIGNFIKVKGSERSKIKGLLDD